MNYKDTCSLYRKAYGIRLTSKDKQNIKELLKFQKMNKEMIKIFYGLGETANG